MIIKALLVIASIVMVLISAVFVAMDTGMTIKSALTNLWLTIRYGQWVVRRGEQYVPQENHGLAPIKAEGAEVSVDPWIRYEYYAACERTSDLVLCESKRDAEAVCAYNNDMRGRD